MLIAENTTRLRMVLSYSNVKHLTSDYSRLMKRTIWPKPSFEIKYGWINNRIFASLPGDARFRDDESCF